MQKLTTYVKESYQELMHKVAWPTWSELQESAITVMVATIIISLIVFSIDLVFNFLLKLIYQMA